MSCNIKRIKGCEIAGSTFNGRKLSLNRDISNDTFKAKVKTFNQKSIAEITGVKNATGIYFPFSGLENLSAGLYIIEYWGNFEDIGNELFCVEEFSVVAPSKAGEAQFCDNSNVFNFVTEDVSIDIQITATIVNIVGGGDLSNYYTKSETYSKIEVDDIIADIPVVDTSNLIPYIGATQNVNIGAYYFESSAGFKKTGGTATQALTANGGVYDLTTKADLVGGKVPSSQLPSYVDDVLEFANLASFPATGESGKIYIAIDTNITYRWGGSSYVIMTSSLALGETSSTAYRGDRGKIAYDHSQTTGNPHGTTKTDIGLGNVDNTSDLNKPISTATQQALNNKLDKGTYTGNASDLKSLIDTKADLVGGKVLASQSQPSTMVMDNSTYAITFTDATGAVQTIDLPLESLFKDANYNASTKSLIVTLQDGTTRTIPLTDLVDLPEIVSSNTNPAVNPTTGQKVYFNTSLGKVWFNVSGAWVFAGNLISDSEKTNLSNAYTHSQATGNPHNTTKADIGLGNVDNTSDLDKPISTATQNALNVKANIVDIPSKTSFTYDILVANWTLVSGKYEAVISNAGILANSFVDIIPSNDHVDIVRAAQIYPSILISAGSVKVYSKFLPSGTISVTVNIN